MVKPLNEIFPGLKDFRITSPADKRYNCIAFAAGDLSIWWWPVVGVKEVFWPDGIARAETLVAFSQVFASLGYVDCEHEAFEQGFEKVALFANEQGIPTHAARQQADGRWKSKLGELED